MFFFNQNGCITAWTSPLFVTADNREEEDDEEVQIENWERPFSNLHHLHFCIRSRRGGSGRADFLLFAEWGRGLPYLQSSPRTPLRRFKQQKDRKCDPGLITAGAAVSENGEQRADKEVSVLFPVGCFVRCERLNVSLCVKMNCLCSEVATPNQGQTKKPPHELPDESGCAFFLQLKIFVYLKERLQASKWLTW